MLKFSDYKNLVNNNTKAPLVLYGAGLIGKLILESLKQKNINVDYFCDRDEAKYDTEIKNIKVISPTQLKDLDKNTNIFICYYTFDSIANFLNESGFQNLYEGSELLNDDFVTNIANKTIDVRSGYGSIDTNDADSHLKVIRQIDFYNKMSFKDDYSRAGKLHLKSIDIQITEKCSLKCKDCCNLMQYYTHAKDSDLELLFKSIDRFISSIDILDEFRVIGGDPFMNKNLYKVINKLVTYDKCKSVVVYTNGRIPPKGENLESLRNKKVMLDITNYGEISTAHEKVLEICRKENLAFSTLRTSVWTDSGRIMPYSNKNEKELENLFSNCCNTDLISLLHGKLYRCPFSANGVNLKAIPQQDSDEVNLLDDSLDIPELRKRIKKLAFDKKYLTACSYCNGRDYSTLKIPAAVQTKKPLPFEVK